MKIQKLIIVLNVFLSMSTYNPIMPIMQNGLKLESFGDSSISKELYDYILANLPAGSTILELGSGWATGQLAQHYTMYSIEHDKKWINNYTSNYIYAPLKNGWYDPSAIKGNLPKNYDLILVDGPIGSKARKGFLEHISLFNTNVLIIIDDLDRPNEFKMIHTLAKMLNREIEMYNGARKKFGVLNL